MIAPNNPEAMVRYVNEAIKFDIPYVFDPAFNIPHIEVRNLRNAIKNSKILIGNDYEIEMIKKRLRLSKRELLKLTKIVITTLGSKGSKVETRSLSLAIPSSSASK